MMWTRNSVILLVLSLAVFGGGQETLIAQSGTTSALSGTATDATGAGLAGATVTTTFVRSKAERSVKTGLDGTFFFLQLTEGVYRVSVQAQGFASTSQDVTYAGVP